jgi:hypothetical protein
VRHKRAGHSGVRSPGPFILKGSGFLFAMNRIAAGMATTRIVLTAIAVGLCSLGFSRMLEAQLHHTVGVRPAIAFPAAPVRPGVAPSSVALAAVQDSTGKPLIGAPTWWPERPTHQNVAFLTAAGVVTFGIMWILPEDVSKWDKSVPMSVYLKRSYTRAPVWDSDEFYWNYIIHPVAGMWIYLMERNHGRKPIRGFLLSTAASVGWEYGFEAFIEQPSMQDLLFTSTIGSVFGELAHRATLGMKANGFNVLEGIAVTILNPAYVINNGYR